MKLIKIKFRTLIIILAGIVYLITAYNSVGFYHADEHYQIIEFAGSKLGTHNPNELAWEYNAQIRPAMQPAICYLIFKTLIFFKITNPYSQTFILRLLTAILSLFVITFFVKQTENLFKNKKGYYLLSYFLWFIPFISVRFSSETWSGLLFLLSVAIFFSNKAKTIKPYLLGITMGFSFLFRYQMAISVVGFVLWLIFIEKIKFINLSKIIISFLFVVFIGCIIDTWFYNKIVFTPWNYFYTTIISNDVIQFGIKPYYFYLLQLLKSPTYFVGILLILSFVILLISKPKSVFLWIVLPFIFIHSLIPHKELRFIFPLAFFAPVILMYGYENILKLLNNKYTVKIINAFIIIFFIVNIAGLIIISQKPARIGWMSISKYIHNNYGNKNINLIYTSWANPYNPWQHIPIKFYSEKYLFEKNIKTLNNLSDSLIINNTENLLVIRKKDIVDTEYINAKKIKNFTFEKQSIPKWIEMINKKIKWFDNKNILLLYRYDIDKN